MKNQFIIAVIIGVFAGRAALAGGGDLPYPKEVFDATYEVKGICRGQAFDSTMRMAYDGKGHGVVDMTQKGILGDGRVIYDYLKMESLSLLENPKRVYRRKLTNWEGLPTDIDALKKEGAKEIGTRNIDGHNCHGWEKIYSSDFKTTTWIGDDTHYMVHQDIGDLFGLPNWLGGYHDTTTTSLKSWSSTGPSAADLTVPVDYPETRY